MVLVLAERNQSHNPHRPTVDLKNTITTPKIDQKTTKRKPQQKTAKRKTVFVRRYFAARKILKPNITYSSS